MLIKFILLIFLMPYFFSMIIFPFKTALNNIESDNIDYNLTNFLNDYNSQPAYITLKIGNPSQEVNVLLTYNDCGFKIGKAKNCINNDNYLSYYNRNSSTDFKYTDLFNKSSMEFRNGRSAEDSIYAYTDLDMKKLQKFENIGFYLGTDTNDPLCGIIGFTYGYFKLYCDEMNNIFTSFKMREIVNNNDWMLKYASNNEGLLIFNPDLSKIVNNYDFNKLFITNNEKSFQQGLWTLSINKVYSSNVNGSIINKSQNADINNDFGLIEGSGEYYYNITKTFFKDYILERICYLEEVKVGMFYYYYAIECDKKKFGKEDLEKFPTLSLVVISLQTEFILDYNDLFTETEYKYFFNVIFHKFVTDKWVLGKPFLKKYPLIINYDAQTIGYYNDDIEDQSKDKKAKNHIISEKFLIIIIIIIIIVIIIVSITCYFIGKNLNKTKKRKANELDDDYDYSSSKDEDNNLLNEEFKTINK